MIYEENITAKVLPRFVRRLIRDAGRKVFMVLAPPQGSSCQVSKGMVRVA